MSNLSFDKPQNFALNIHCRLMRFSIENSKNDEEKEKESVCVCVAG